MAPTWVAGVLCGVVASVGVGPVNLTIIEQALSRGFRGAFLAGLGAICAETIYAVLALAGHASLPHNRALSLAIRGAALVMVVVLGVRYLLYRQETAKLQAIAEKVDARWHHPKALLLGFLVTISSITPLLLWVTLTTWLFDQKYVQPVFASRLTCASGVFVGGLSWYSLLGAFVARAHRGIRPGTLTALQRGCGLIFLIFAALLAYGMLWR